MPHSTVPAVAISYVNLVSQKVRHVPECVEGPIKYEILYFFGEFAAVVAGDYVHTTLELLEIPGQLVPIINGINSMAVFGCHFLKV